MSERGQNIFKIIVWIAISLGVILYAVKVINGGELIGNSSKRSDSVITKTEWMELLENSFGTSVELDGEAGTEILTGEYAAVTSMDAIGEDRIAYLTNEKLTDEEKIRLAVEYGIITQKQLNDKVTNDEAKEIILNALNVYCDPCFYPDYFEADLKAEVLNADRWSIENYDKDTQIMTASIHDRIPEKEEIIMYTDEFGIAQARRVISIDEAGDSKYILHLSEVEDASDIFNSVSFSGSADFGYLTGNNSSSKWEDPFYCKGDALRDLFTVDAYAAELNQEVAMWEWLEDKTAIKGNETSQKCDLEFNVELTEKNGNSAKITSYISVKSNGITRKYIFSIDDEKTEFKENVSLSDGLSFELSENDKKGRSADTGYFKDEMGVAAKVKITDFSVSTSGYVQWADLEDVKNYVEVIAAAKKVEISTAAKLKSETKKKIGELPIPIASSGGVISVNLNVYLVVSASGEVTIWYEVTDPTIGFKASVAEKKIRLIHNSSDEDAGVRAKIELSEGVIGEVAVKLVGHDLANPAIDARVYETASSLEVGDLYELKSNYENMTCSEMTVQAPVVKLTVSTGETFLKKVLDKINVKVTYDVIKKDDSKNAWLKIQKYHIEQEPDGALAIIQLTSDQKNEDVCTHIQKKKETTVLHVSPEVEKRNAEKEVKEEKEKAKNELEHTLEDALDKWFMENCNDCN